MPPFNLSNKTTGRYSTVFRLVGSLWALAVSGCVAVPVGMFTESPYTPEVMQKLSQKNADKRLVQATLGKPFAMKSSGHYWFYTNSRTTWGIIGGSSSAVITDDEWLAVQFDDTSHVMFVEHNKLDKCLSNGMCFGGFAPTLDDAAAKSYEIASNECAVYLFLKPLTWPLVTGAAKYSIDGKVLGLVNTKSYLFLTHQVGDIRISAYQLKMTAECIGGEKLYIGAVKAADFSWDTGKDLIQVSPAEGEAAIRVRRLALPD